MTFPIKCYDCGHGFDTMRVTASLKCARCGSDDIDLDDRTASGGTGWNQPRPNTLEGWAVQPPVALPGPNPYAATDNVGDDARVCPACKGTGVDSRASGGGYNEVPCRNCHGTGKQSTHADSPGPTHDGTGASGPAVGGSRFPFESGRRSSDPMGSADDYIRGTDPNYDNRSGEVRKAPNRSKYVKYRDGHSYEHGSAPLPLTGAECPSCGAGSTQLVRDGKDHAWWHCQNCGSLANIDANPEINPFDPPAHFVPDRSFGEKKKTALFRRKANEEPKPGKALKMVRATLQVNPGLSVGQALTLVRNALAKYPE